MRILAIDIWRLNFMTAKYRGIDGVANISSSVSCRSNSLGGTFWHDWRFSSQSALNWQVARWMVPWVHGTWQCELKYFQRMTHSGVHKWQLCAQIWCRCFCPHNHCVYLFPLFMTNLIHLLTPGWHGDYLPAISGSIIIIITYVVFCSIIAFIKVNPNHCTSFPFVPILCCFVILVKSASNEPKF